jgi:succinate dehydrogenase/fumarate reductase flavoprotein subunit
MAEQFDLVILGSGSTALAAALRAAELGKTAAMTEVRSSRESRQYRPASDQGFPWRQRRDA